MRRVKAIKKLAALALALLMIVPPFVSRADDIKLVDVPYANSDSSADTPAAFYEIEPTTGALLQRDPDTLQAKTLTQERISQLALFDDALYLLRTDDNALLRYTPANGAFKLLRKFDAEVLRFAVTENAVFYLSDETIFRSRLDGREEQIVVSAPGLYRFWLTDGLALEYMTEESTIHRLDLASGKRSERENEISALSSNLRGLRGINQLKRKFPMGKYWNHCGGKNNLDGWTDIPCTHHGYHGSGCNIWDNGCACNYYHESIQCYAFAYKLTDEYYGSNPDDWDNRIWYNPTKGIKAGDVFRYKYNRHTIWITAVNGDTVTYADCNYDGTCVIRWNQTASVSTLRASANWRDVAPYELDLRGDIDTPEVLTEHALYYDDNRVVVSWTPLRGADGYTVEVVKDGELLETKKQEECELRFMSPQIGEYTVSVTGYNDFGTSERGSCSFTVSHTERNTAIALWASATEQGEECSHLLYSEPYVLNVRLFDTVTGQDYAEYGDGTFTLSYTVTAPDGIVLAEREKENLCGDTLELTADQLGIYTVLAKTSGAVEMMQTLEILCREPDCEDIGHAWDLGTETETDGGAVIEYTCNHCGAHSTLSFPEGELAAAAVFEDMPGTTDWAYQGLAFLLSNGVMNGVNATKLAPQVTMDRAMLVTLLWRLEGRPPVPRPAAFTDVEPVAYYSQAVAWAARCGVVMGTSAQHFSPKLSITREQLATILYRYAVMRGASASERAELSEFPDAENVSGFAQEAMAWAVVRGLVRGTMINGRITLSPKSSATRAQVATILRRFVKELATAEEPN